jgi:hypothetical protein
MKSFLYTFVSLFLFLIIIRYTFFVCESFGKYSDTVNLPINDPYSCKNFCGPMSQCSITREQCTSDHDCYGCKIESFDLMESSEIYPGSQFAQIKKPYLGKDLWTSSFNKGLQQYNDKHKLTHNKYMPKYPTTLSATGLFYETMPIASNSTIF